MIMLSDVYINLPDFLVRIILVSWTDIMSRIGQNLLGDCSSVKG